MLRLFLERHLFTLLNAYATAGMPLDYFLRRYFQQHRALGAHDRRLICEALYDLVRWRELLDHLGEREGGQTDERTWEKRYATWTRVRPCETYATDTSLPPHVRVSFPRGIVERLATHLGEERALELCLISNGQAPTTIRINPLKTTRLELFNKWKDDYPVTLTPRSPLGINFARKVALFSMPEFKEGLFEVQDEGSQLVADLAEVEPGDEILDYCAGSGGKTLALAHKLQGKGQIYLHDVRESALLQAKARLKRAGIQNAQLLLEGSRYKVTLKGRMKWVLADVPCTGSGTWRRNPDMKWKFEDALLERLIAEQRSIVSSALNFLKPKGKLLYATCSLFKEENEEQIAYFEKNLGLKCLAPPFQTSPEPGGMDGFFAAILQKC